MWNSRPRLLWMKDPQWVFHPYPGAAIATRVSTNWPLRPIRRSQPRAAVPHPGGPRMVFFPSARRTCLPRGLRLQWMPWNINHPPAAPRAIRATMPSIAPCSPDCFPTSVPKLIPTNTRVREACASACFPAPASSVKNKSGSWQASWWKPPNSTAAPALRFSHSGWRNSPGTWWSGRTPIRGGMRSAGR